MTGLRRLAQPPARTPSASPLGREVEVERIQLIVGSMRRLPWVHGTLILCLAPVMYRFVKLPVFSAWAVLAIAIEIARTLFLQHVVRLGFAIDPRQVHAVLIVQAIVAGALVGAGAVLFLPELPVTRQALYGGILFVIPAASAIVSQSSRSIVVSYTAAILIPTTLAWLHLHPHQSAVLAALTLLYTAVIVFAAADGDKLLMRAITIRHERDRLVRDLEQRNVEVRAAVGRAEASAQARAQVLGAASHDLRQPLHALSVYSAVLATNPPPEAMRELSANIEHVAQSLGNLLNGLLDLSSISTDHYAIDHDPIYLDTVVGAVCAEFACIANEKGIALRFDGRPTLVLGDALAVGRITRNLVDNAIKYTDRGDVVVSIDRDETGDAPSAILSVADTGRGIPASERERIFEEFYQINNPGRDRMKGIGLGLTIVRRLCELSGIEVWVESELYCGAIFKVRLPLATAPPVTADPSPPAATVEVCLDGLRVYVADDEADITRGMAQLLEAWGIQTRTAESITAAEQLLLEHGAPDLFITDLRFADSENGATFAARMQRQLGAFPVLVITGETSATVLQETQQYGFMVMDKPIATERLRDAIAALALLNGAGQVTSRGVPQSKREVESSGDTRAG